MATRKTKTNLDKSPYQRRFEGITDKAFGSVKKSVDPVAKDTNKTRRKETKERIAGPGGAIKKAKIKKVSVYSQLPRLRPMDNMKRGKK